MQILVQAQISTWLIVYAKNLPAEGILFLILRSGSDLFDYKAAPTIAGDQRDIGLTGIDLDLLTGLRIIVMCDSILGRLGPGNFDSLTLSNVVTGASGGAGGVGSLHPVLQKWYPAE